MSLVDEDRQWFKSHYGLDARETSRDFAFCAHAILGDDIFYVKDSDKDERFFDNPLVLNAPYVKFYAGIPLSAGEGYKVGTLCVIDNKPRELTEKQINALRCLARQVESQLKLKKKLKKIDLINKDSSKALEAKSNELENRIMIERTQEAAKIGSWVLDLRTHKVTWSKTTFDIHEESYSKEILLENGINYYVEEHRPIITKAVEDAVELQKGWDLELKIKTAKNNIKWVRAIGHTVVENGEVIKLEGTFQDITEMHNALSELKARTETLENLQDTINDGYWDWNIKTGVNYTSPRYWEMFGFDPKTKEHIIDEAMNALYEGDKERVQDAMQRHFDSKGEIPYGEDIRFVHADGSHVWVHCRGKVVEWDEDGSPIRMIGAHTDLTKAKKQEKAIDSEREKFKALYENSPDAYLIIETKGEVIIDCNRATEKILKGTKEEIIGLNPRVLSPEFQPCGTRSKDLVPGNTQKVIENGIHRFSWQHQRLDGEEFPCDVHITLIKYEGRNAILCGWRDMTEAKKQELELVKEKEKAQNAEKAKSLFLANMSHEIRTPMNGITGMASLLEGTIKDPDDLEKLEIIKECSDSLLTIVNNILDLSKIDAEKLELELLDFDLRKLIQNQLMIFSTVASEKGLIIDSNIDDFVPDFINTDQVRLGQILKNLISNAIKFTSVGGGIELSVATLNEKNDDLELEFRVKDSGIGINKEDQERLFDTFTQADSSTTRRFGGTGLGLSICKILSQKLGGDIRVESEAGKGTEFIFTIKCSKASHSEISKAAHQNNEIDSLLDINLRILAVEDNKINQKVLQGFLKKFNLFPDIAENGLQCLKMLKENEYDIILMDCHMPVMDGFETTKRIISKYRDRRPTIIALTASSMKEDIERCYESGMDDFLSKPLDKKLLGQTLVKYMNKIKKAV